MMLNNKYDEYFKMICRAYPETYDIIVNDELIGYIKLRYGNLSASIYYHTGNLTEMNRKRKVNIFEVNWRLEQEKGEFSNDEERKIFLQHIWEIVKKAIAEERQHILKK